MADVPALRRAVAMLRAVSLSNEPMSAGQLSRELDIPRSTVYDILAVLEELNVVSKRKNGYVPGPASTGVGAAYLRSVPLVNAAAPAMRALADAIDGCVHLSTLRGNEAQILTADRGPDAPMCPSWPGDVQPVATSAAGQAILSCLPKGAIAELIDEDLLPKVLEELRAVRLRGYAIEHTATIPARGPSAPLCSPDQVRWLRPFPSSCRPTIGMPTTNCAWPKPSSSPSRGFLTV